MLPYKRWSAFRTSFQFKLFAVFTLLTFFISCLLSTLLIITVIKNTRHNANNDLELQLKYLVETTKIALYAENSEALRLLAEQELQTPEINAVVITTPNGKVLADVRSPGTSGQSDVITKSTRVYSGYLANSVELSMSSGRERSATLLGTVRIERGTDDLTRKIHKTIVLSVIIAVAFWLSVSLLFHLVLRRVTSSFSTLVQGIKKLEDGDLSYRIDINTDDEAGKAAKAVNNLTESLQRRSEENTRLQEDQLNLERQILNTQKLESLGVMAGGIAHDFNNLLQSILGNMELALSHLEPGSALKKYIDRAMTSSKRAALLTSLMLTYVGKGLITKRELDLNELVNENAEILGMGIPTTVTLELSLSQELPAMKGDEAQIQQVVMNLITNAAESTNGQSGTVKITTGAQNCDEHCLTTSLLDERSAPGRYVYLEVSDTGCGMNQETLDRLFDPFFTTKFTGRGLGMSAVRGVIKAHHGALFVESEPGKGTTFRVMFPAVVPVQPLAIQGLVTQPVKNNPIENEALSGLALVVDDERAVQRVCAKMASLCGFTVIKASDGLEAVSIFREHADEIDVVLMDLVMPNMDGIAAMNEIFSIRPDARVIISSGFNKEELSDRITGQAPSGFIRKPYNINLLEAELRKVMQK